MILMTSIFAGMAKNAEAFIDDLGLRQIDLLGFCVLQEHADKEFIM